MEKNIKMDYLTQNGQMVNYKTKKNGTNKKTKKTSIGFTKSYMKNTKKIRKEK